MAKQLQLSYNGIQYTKVYQPAVIIGGKIGFDNYIIDENYNITNIYDPETYGTIVNAIDIDWNGAELEENLTLNNTSDLLNRVKNTYTKDQLYTQEHIDEKITTLSQVIANTGETLNNKIDNLDVYTTSYIDALVGSFDNKYATKTNLQESISDLQTQITALQNRITEISDQLNNSQVEDGYYLWVGNRNNIPDHIDSSNGTLIHTEQNLSQIFVSGTEPNDNNINWAFVLPNIYDYDFVNSDDPDNELLKYNDYITIIDNNYLEKYRLYNIATGADSAISLIAKII